MTSARPHAWQQWFWLWDLVFALELAGTGALVLLMDDDPLRTELVAVGGLAGIAASYLLAGRRIARTEGGPPRSGLLFIGVLIGFLAVGVAADPAVGFALWALCPMIFMCLRPLAAAGACAIAISLPLVIDILRRGFATPEVPILLPMTALMIVFAACIGFWLDRVVRQSAQRASLIEQLEASRAEVARLSHETGTAAERERLAREIHDTLAQGFTSIITLAQAADSELDTDPEAARHHLRLAARTARENLAEARAMVAALTPSALDGSLADAIRRQTARLGEETGIDARFSVTGELPPLPTAVEVVLLRATQEALHNVRKHSGASEAAVSLSTVDEGVRLMITDNGSGLDPAARTEGFGLRGIRARAEQVGGTFDVRGSASGTTVEVTVPA